MRLPDLRTELVQGCDHAGGHGAGRCDVFFPDSTSLIGAVIAIKASGAFEKAIYLEELNIADVNDVAKRVAGAFTPAG